MSVLKYLNDTQTARLWAKIKAGFVSKSGDTMTGALTLAGDPVSDLQAATKKYVDDNAGGGSVDSVNGQTGVVVLDASDVGAQASITASGMLKADGNGNVSAAVAGTDYIASHQDISGKLDKSGGTMTGTLTLAGEPVSDLQASTKKYVDDNSVPTTRTVNGKALSSNITLDANDVGALPDSTTIPAQISKLYTAVCTTGPNTATKDAILDDDTDFYLTDGVRVAVTFIDGNTATTPSLFIGDSSVTTPVYKNIVIPASNDGDYWYGNGTTYNSWAPFETVVFTYTGAYWAHTPSGYLCFLSYKTASDALPKSGGNMTGALTLSGAPTSNLHAATKKYVDDYVGDIETLLASI